MPDIKKKHLRAGSAWKKLPFSAPWSLFIAISLFFVVRYILPIGTVEEVDPEKVRVGLAILAFAGFLWLTEAIPLALTALLIPIVAVVTGVLNVGEGFQNFAHPLIFLFLGGFGLAAALSRQEIDRWLAQKLVHLSRGHFLTTSIALCVASAVLSMWISNTATVALLLPVALGIIREIRTVSADDQAHRAAMFILLGIAYSASIGGMGSLIGTAPNLIAAQYLKIDFVGWLAIGLPCAAILLPLALILLFVVLRPRHVPDMNPEVQPFEWTVPRVTTLVVFLLAVLAWLNGRFISDLLGVTSGFDTVIAVTALVLLAALKLVNWADIDRTTDWAVLLLFGGGLTLSEILKPNRTGASTYLASELSVITSQLPVILIIGCVVFFVIFLTELSSNTATTALLVPIFGRVALEMGFEPSQLILPLAFAASCAFMLPIATPPNAIVFGSGEIPQRTMMRVGIVLNIVLGLVLTGLSQVLF